MAAKYIIDGHTHFEDGADGSLHKVFNPLDLLNNYFLENGYKVERVAGIVTRHELSNKEFMEKYLGNDRIDKVYRIYPAEYEVGEKIDERSYGIIRWEPIKKSYLQYLHDLGFETLKFHGGSHSTSKEDMKTIENGLEVGFKKFQFHTDAIYNFLGTVREEFGSIKLPEVISNITSRGGKVYLVHGIDPLLATFDTDKTLWNREEETRKILEKNFRENIEYLYFGTTTHGSFPYRFDKGYQTPFSWSKPETIERIREEFPEAIDHIIMESDFNSLNNSKHVKETAEIIEQSDLLTPREINKILYENGMKYIGE